MAIPERDFMYPRFIRYREGATLSRDDGARFNCMDLQYGSGRAWRNQPIPGYNAQNPRVLPDKVNLSTDVPFIRAR